MTDDEEISQEEEDAEADQLAIDQVTDCLAQLDSQTQTFVFMMFDYATGEYNIFSNAYTAEEAFTIFAEGANLTKEDCLEENKLDWPVDKRFH